MRTRASLIIGRERELTFLEEALDGARMSCGGAVCVVGEPGIGKTRLVNEIAAAALACGMRVIRGRGSTIGPVIPFRPLSEALLAVARPGVRPDFGEFSPYRSILGRLVPEWSVGSDEPGDLSLVVFAEAVLRLLSVLGQASGCVMVVDDLQDCDAETLTVLEYLTDNLHQQPVLLVMAARPKPGQAFDLVQAAVQRGSTTALELHRLDRDEVAQLVSECLDADRATLPEPLVDQIWDNSVGVPFVVEELLHGITSSGCLIRGADGLLLAHQVPLTVPMTLTRSITERADRLGPQGRSVLAAAAVFGRRFPVDVVQRVTELDEPALLNCLQAGVAAQLVTVDEAGPDWYNFQHPLIVDALLAQLAPGHRADLSRRATEAVQLLHPGLPGEWCQQAAVLSMAAGDDVGAADHFAEAGRRAFDGGAMDSAVVLLEHAVRLLPSRIKSAAHADVVESLLYALVETAQADRALQLMDTFNTHGGAGLDSARRAALHARLAWAACIAGQPDRANEHIALARTLLGAQPADEHAASLDRVAADVAMGNPGAGRMRQAELLALRAVEAADRASLPDIACHALQTAGVAARDRDPLESRAFFERARVLAERHRLPQIARLTTYACIAREDWLLDGDAGGMEQARSNALQTGLILFAHNAEAMLGMDSVIRGRFAAAAERLDRCRSAAIRMRLTRIVRFTRLGSALLAAHQARRGEMEQELAEVERLDGKSFHWNALVMNTIRAVCSLIEEDHGGVAVDLQRLRQWEADIQPHHHLISSYGLHLLTAVLRDQVSQQEYRAAQGATSSHMRWNRQFMLLAEAVLAGRDGRPADAVSAFKQAQTAAAPYAMARHLGLRLVAPAAIADGWGDPIQWLRQAEHYFHHHTGGSAVARACRGRSDLARPCSQRATRQRSRRCHSPRTEPLTTLLKLFDGSIPATLPSVVGTEP